MKFSRSLFCIIAAVNLNGAPADAQVSGAGGEAPENHGAIITRTPPNEVQANEALNSNKITTSPLRSRYLQSGSSSGGLGSVILDVICAIIRIVTLGFVSFCSDGGGLGSGSGDELVPVCRPPIIVMIFRASSISQHQNLPQRMPQLLLPRVMPRAMPRALPRA